MRVSLGCLHGELQAASSCLCSLPISASSLHALCGRGWLAGSQGALCLHASLGGWRVSSAPCFAGSLDWRPQPQGCRLLGVQKPLSRLIQASSRLGSQGTHPGRKRERRPACVPAPLPQGGCSGAQTQSHSSFPLQHAGPGAEAESWLATWQNKGRVTGFWLANSLGGERAQWHQDEPVGRLAKPLSLFRNRSLWDTFLGLCFER